MRGWIKKLVIFVSIVVVVKASYADELFYQFNKDLEQVGITEFSKTVSTPFKGEIYRLAPDFELGVGDTLIINLWGKLEDKYTLVIDKDGKILIPRIGSVYVVGNTLEEAKEKIKNGLSQKYVNVQFDLSLGNVQDIRVSVLGNVKKPGMFSVNPFAKVVDGLISAGGPTENGSLKSVKLIRGNKVVNVFDYYQFVLKGDDSKNIALQHGDKVFVPICENLIAIRGDVARPGIYEMDKENTLSDVVEIAGGLLPSKFTKKIQVIRFEKSTKQMMVAKEIVFDDFNKVKESKDDVKLEYQDTIVVTTEFNFSPFTKDIMNMVTIYGEVTTPGRYIIEDGETLTSLIKRAGGITGFAYPEGAILKKVVVKEKQKEFVNNIVMMKEMDILEEEAKLAKAIVTEEEKRMLQSAIDRKRKALNLFAVKEPNGRVIMDLPKIFKGEEDDVVLEKNDDLYIPPIPNWVLVNGAVYNPESVIFEEGQKLSYYLEKVGGPIRTANVDEIYIIKPDGSVIKKSSGAETISRGDIIVVPEKEDSYVR